MNPLAARIRWILKNRKTNQRQLARDAGLTEAHIAVFLSRAKNDPDADIERETLAKIARAADVSIDWLADGRGKPDADAPTEPTTTREDETSIAGEGDGSDVEPLARALAHVYSAAKGKWSLAELDRATKFVRAGHRGLTATTDEALVEVADGIMRAVHDCGVTATDATIGLRWGLGKHRAK